MYGLCLLYVIYIYIRIHICSVCNMDACVCVCNVMYVMQICNDRVVMYINYACMCGLHACV